VPEEPRDFSTFKITLDAKKWVRGEQTRIFTVEGDEPTQAELFDRMRKAYEAALADGPKAEPAHEPARKSKIHYEEEYRLLEYILDHGTPEERQWITGNLKMFGEAIRHRPGGAARRAGGKS